MNRTVPVAISAPSRSGRELWLRCCHGLEPAEALDPRDREDLVAELVTRGWSDVQIATHTRMSTYTTGRIRERMQLPPNPAGVGRQGAVA